MTVGYVTDQGEGDCGLVAASLVLNSPLVGALVLCHGYPVNQSEEYQGLRFWHAWAETENGNIVFDFSNGNKTVIPRQLYYAVGQIDENEVARFDHEEARALLMFYGHYGPWDAEHPPIRETAEDTV